MTEHSATKKRPESSPLLKKMMEEESRMVKGIFRFHECPGGDAKISMKKYPGTPLKFHFRDGEKYTVPLWVARWLNGYDACAVKRNGKIDSCGYPIHENAIDRVSGRTLVQVGQIRRRMGFESNEFMSI